jgi:3-deoxy-D-manno-octulosonate 8-phosphate phosphatase (KDO 8-P phosphatase)
MKEIRAIALDVDGVLTDGGVWWGPDAQEWKRFSYSDIMGVSLGMKAGLVFALISGEDSPLVDRSPRKWASLAWRRIVKTRAVQCDVFQEARGLPFPPLAIWVTM